MKNFFLLFWATSFFLSCGQKDYGLTSTPESRAKELASKLKATFSFYKTSDRTGLVFLKAAEEGLTWRLDRAKLHKEKKWLLHLDDERASLYLYQKTTTLNIGETSSTGELKEIKDKDPLDLASLEITKILGEDHNKKREALMNQLLELLKGYTKKNKDGTKIEKKDLLVVVTGKLRDLVGHSH